VLRRVRLFVFGVCWCGGAFCTNCFFFLNDMAVLLLLFKKTKINCKIDYIGKKKREIVCCRTVLSDHHIIRLVRSNLRFYRELWNQFCL
jgi:hypothetical protein